MNEKFEDSHASTVVAVKTKTKEKKPNSTTVKYFAIKEQKLRNIL